MVDIVTRAEFLAQIGKLDTKIIAGEGFSFLKLNYIPGECWAKLSAVLVLI